MEASDLSLTEDDHMEFQMMLNKLDLPYALPEFDAERESELVKESPAQVFRKKRVPKTISTPAETKQKDKQVRSESIIPPIENFQEFKSWVLKKLDELENIS